MNGVFAASRRNRIIPNTWNISIPERVSKLVLMCPIGLWLDEMPIPNWMLITPAADMPKYLFYEPDSPLARMAFGQADEEGNTFA